METNLFNEYDHEAKLRRDVYFTIDRHGNWYFHGSQNPGPMKRTSLVKLFADKGLKKKDRCYVLSSPFESYLVDVEDVPFIVTEFRVLEDEKAQTLIELKTNIGDTIQLGQTHSLELRPNKLAREKLPYVEVKDGLWARLNRPVRYDLIDRALRQRGDIKPGERLYLTSGGSAHPLAEWDETP